MPKPRPLASVAPSYLLFGLQDSPLKVGWDQLTAATAGKSYCWVQLQKSEYFVEIFVKTVAPLIGFDADDALRADAQGRGSLLDGKMALKYTQTTWNYV